jgi:hypothetical protein
MKKNTFIALTLIVTLCTLGISGIRFNAVDIYEAYYLLKIEYVAITSLWLLTLTNMMRIYKELHVLRSPDKGIKLEVKGKYIIWVSGRYFKEGGGRILKAVVNDMTKSTIIFFDMDDQEELPRMNIGSSHYSVRELVEKPKSRTES